MVVFRSCAWSYSTRFVVSPSVAAGRRRSERTLRTERRSSVARAAAAARTVCIVEVLEALLGFGIVTVLVRVDLQRLPVGHTAKREWQPGRRSSRRQGRGSRQVEPVVGLLELGCRRRGLAADDGIQAGHAAAAVRSTLALTYVRVPWCRSIWRVAQPSPAARPSSASWPRSRPEALAATSLARQDKTVDPLHVHLAITCSHRAR
jgi:hypothetical protein